MKERISNKNFIYKTTAQRRWTDAAIKCYKRGCVCEGCFYDEFFHLSSFSCRMKGAVLELVRTVGTPPVQVAEVLNEDE